MSPIKDQPRVHILGLGSIGTFTAHSVSELRLKPAVTLLLHRDSLVDAYRESGNQIALETREGDVVRSSGYALEVQREGRWYQHPAPLRVPTESPTIIQHLIVSVKSTQTVAALQPLKHRLSAESTILFLQNGCGMIDDINSSIFPDLQTRPNYIVGVVSHGVTLNQPFHVTHTGFAAMSLGLVPRSTATSAFPSSLVSDSSISSKYLLDCLPLSPRLNATSYSYPGVLQIQLEKLAVNAFCNPLCALNDAKNAFLFTIPDTRRKLLTEISKVILNLPELQNVPGVRERFAIDRLEMTVNEILTRTAETTCSMVWDLRAGRETEVKYISGYWVKRGKEVGVPTPVNESLMQKVMERGCRLK
ncbi:hypothetical protein FE257_009192 [Aspergillus nanangensis]|uniref:2-dehydropantoate 2-reductase n=1 Tax=Aspergillus nanangensis TaxID=2582783 RepID=A0AAD4CMA7_ASPNN|nr:hypothetical protein FE257_009192 [Aspergillus nanangensis]